MVGNMLTNAHLRFTSRPVRMCQKRLAIWIHSVNGNYTSKGLPFLASINHIDIPDSDVPRWIFESIGRLKNVDLVRLKNCEIDFVDLRYLTDVTFLALQATRFKQKVPSIELAQKVFSTCTALTGLFVIDDFNPFEFWHAIATFVSKNKEHFFLDVGSLSGEYGGITQHYFFRYGIEEFPPIVETDFLYDI